MSGITREAFRDATKRADVALQNEQVTRQRVAMLEEKVQAGHEERIRLNASFLARFMWLLRGEK